MAALRRAVLQPANQLRISVKTSGVYAATSEFQESCPGFWKCLKASHDSAVEAVLRSTKPR